MIRQLLDGSCGNKFMEDIWACSKRISRSSNK